MVASKLGDVRMVGDKVVQKVCELVALSESHVTAQQVLVGHTKVEVIAERVHMHQVPHFITFLSEQH